MHYINITVSGVFTPEIIRRGLFVRHFRTWAHEWYHIYESSQDEVPRCENAHKQYYKLQHQ